MSECDQFKVGTRKRSICEGSAALSLDKINAYREQWGLGPITKDNPVRKGIILPKKTNTARASRKRAGGQPVKHNRVAPRRAPRAGRKEVPKKGLGDRIEQALTVVGITSERVENWLGRPCNCAKRKRKLNQLGAWVTRVLTGKTENAEQYLEDMIDEG